MIVIVGESGSGKTTLANKLVEKYNYNRITTYTTRPLRKGERNDIDYHFISEEEFMILVKKGFFAEVGFYNNWHYGTAKKDCTNYKVIVVTPSGLRQLKQNKDLNIVSFYLYTPRRDRLIKLLQRGDNIEEAYRRSLSDVGQFDGIENEVDYVLSNPSYGLSVDELADKVVSICNSK